MTAAKGPHVISASRRTDLPAFYSQWFMKRVEEGCCDVPNPFNPQQVSRVSLRPEDVHAFVFWTRNPRPLMRFLPRLHERGYRFYFLFTLLDNPPELDPHTPPAKVGLQTFQDLAAAWPGRVVWRYDPIVLSGKTPVAYHLENFERLGGQLAGSTRRVVISLLDFYRKAQGRLEALEGPARVVAPREEDLDVLIPGLQRIARAHGLSIQSCAQERLLFERYGLLPGRCIDDQLLRELFDLQVADRKDPSQRPTCGCVASRDIGVYDTCTFGCRYCYATRSFELARKNQQRLRQEGNEATLTSLIGQHHPGSGAAGADLQLELGLEDPG